MGEGRRPGLLLIGFLQSTLAVSSEKGYALFGVITQRVMVISSRRDRDRWVIPKRR